MAEPGSAAPETCVQPGLSEVIKDTVNTLIALNDLQTKTESQTVDTAMPVTDDIEKPTDEPAGGESGNPSAPVAEATQTPANSDKIKTLPATPPATPIINGNQAPEFPIPSQDPVTLDKSNTCDVSNATSQTIVTKTDGGVDAVVAERTTSIEIDPLRIDAISGPILEAAAIANAVAGISISNPSTPVPISTPPASDAVMPVVSPLSTSQDSASDEGASAPLQTSAVEAKEDVIENSNKSVREDEIEILKARVKILEAELIAAMTKPGTRNQVLVDTIKHQHEELLSKARGMLFDKTKIVKNQELQIEALTAQINSLKDVNSITKDLLEIRNSEIKHLEERMNSMEDRFKAEKERHMLVLKRAETGQSINNDLRTEYEGQLKIFKELREMYERRVQALMEENKRLNESIAASKAEPESSA